MAVKSWNLPDFKPSNLPIINFLSTNYLDTLQKYMEIYENTESVETGETTKPLEYRKCLETGEIAKSPRY